MISPLSHSVDFKKACVIGTPIVHSRSPLIHGYWLEKYQIAGSYEKIEVSPEQLPHFIRGLKSAGYQGCNVTLPHKEAVMACCDVIQPAAQAIGAVNTVWLEGDKICGGNTDAYGFITNLAHAFPDWRKTSSHAAILGAGGAARAVIYGLLEAGIERISLFNRNKARAEELEYSFKALPFRGKITVRDWEDRHIVHSSSQASDVDLLINTTALGMLNQPSLEINIEGLPPHALVTDVVYTPLQTALLLQAKAHGFRTLDGLGMLLYQAVAGFNHWFGVEPEVTPVLKQQVIETL
jgi:shikimate dehydrogenase